MDEGKKERAHPASSSNRRVFLSHQKGLAPVTNMHGKKVPSTQHNRPYLHTTTAHTHTHTHTHVPPPCRVVCRRGGGASAPSLPPPRGEAWPAGKAPPVQSRAVPPPLSASASAKRVGGGEARKASVTSATPLQPRSLPWASAAAAALASYLGAAGREGRLFLENSHSLSPRGGGGGSSNESGVSACVQAGSDCPCFEEGAGELEITNWILRGGRGGELLCRTSFFRKLGTSCW